jgi:methyl-accepting chemotaxis protein
MKKRKGLIGKLQKKLLFFFLLVGLLPVIIGGIIAYSHSSKILKESIASQYQKLAVNVADKVDLFLHERLRELQVLAENPLILGGLKFPATLPRVSDFLKSYAASSGHYHLIVLLDENKNLLAFSEAATQTENFQEFNLDNFMGDFYQFPFIQKLFPDSNGYTLMFSTPIAKYRTEKDKTGGHLVAFLKWDEVTQLVTGLQTDQSRSSWILDREGTFIVHTDQNKVLKEGLFDPIYQQTRNDSYGSRIEKGELTVYTRNPDHKNLTNLAWVVGVSQPLAVALAPVQGLKWRTVGVVLIATIAVSLLALLIANRISRPIISMTQEVQNFVGSTIEEVETQKRDEISILSASMRSLIDYLREMATVATHISQGDLSLQIQPKSQKDVLGYAFTQMIQYLREIAEVANELARGNLTQNIQPKSERDVLNVAFQDMILALRTLVSQIRGNADQITETSAQILARSDEDLRAMKDVTSSAEETSSAMMEMDSSVEEVSANTQTLFAATEEISSSIEQMFNSIKQVTGSSGKLLELSETTAAAINQMVLSIERIAKNAENTRRFHHETNEAAMNGQDSMQKVVASMDKIREVVASATQTIQNLESKSQEIGSILDVIDTIADQTALLALNASIIAAQAGEHGKGFAVVAAEIKELATRVASSTKEIAQIVKGVQHQSANAVEVIREGNKEVDEGVKLVHLAGKVLDHITLSAKSSLTAANEIVHAIQEQKASTQKVMESVNEVKARINEINEATQEQERGSSQVLNAIEGVRGLTEQVKRATLEQSKVTDQVNIAMEKVKELINQSGRSTHRSAQAATELSSQAKGLRVLMERFTLDKN